MKGVMYPVSWDLGAIYGSVEEWDLDYKKLIGEIGKWQMQEGFTEDTIIVQMDNMCAIERLYSKLYMFAILSFDKNMNNVDAQLLLGKIEMVGCQVKEAFSSLSSKIVLLDKDTIFEQFSINGRVEYVHYITKLFDRAKHCLSPDIEKIVTMYTDLVLSSERAYDVLTNTEIKFDNAIDKFGEVLPLSEAIYRGYIRGGDRVLRKDSYEKLHDGLAKYKNTLAHNLSSSIKGCISLAGIKKYSSSLEYCLDVDESSKRVYDNLITALNSNTHLLHRYIDIKKRILNVDEFHMYDLLAPVSKEDTLTYTFEKSVDILRYALAPLGEEYVSDMLRGVKNGWCDVYPSLNKKGTVYSWGSYDTMPYLFLNHTDNLDSTITLAHEIGHSMHSFYSRKEQHSINSEYSLFNAEIASIVNERVLMKHLLSNCINTESRISLICHELEQFRHNIFRQGMFAEFELLIHEYVLRNGAISSDMLCSLYSDINNKYHGGNVMQDSFINIEWARIPHFFQHFYVYKYSCGYVAADRIAKGILDGDTELKRLYKEFLSSGCSDYALRLQQKCGIDLESIDCFNCSFEYFESLLNELDELIGK